MFKRETWRHFDYWLFGVVLVLCVFGIVMIRSAIAGNDELASSVTGQTIFVVLGMGVILFLAAINYQALASMTWWLYGIGVALLIGINLIGQSLLAPPVGFRSVSSISSHPS